VVIVAYDCDMTARSWKAPKKPRPRYLVLKSFVKLLYEHDPMGLNALDNPGAAEEYDGEAVSILARFVESFIIEHEPSVAQELAYNIVQDVFSFWFDTPAHDTAEATSNRWIVDEAKARKLVTALLDVYSAGYPHDTRVPPARVQRSTLQVQKEAT
jgi:hypothetical protein